VDLGFSQSSVDLCGWDAIRAMAQVSWFLKSALCISSLENLSARESPAMGRFVRQGCPAK
jgi:hypothetical protein